MKQSIVRNTTPCTRKTRLKVLSATSAAPKRIAKAHPAPNRSSFSSRGSIVKFASDRFVIPEVSKYKISSSFKFASPIVPASVTSVLEMSSAFKYFTCLQISRRPASVSAVSANTRRSRYFKRLINSIPLYTLQYQEVASASSAQLTTFLHAFRRTSSKFDRFEDPALAISACAAEPQRLLRQTRFEQVAALESSSKSLEASEYLRNGAHQSTLSSQVRPSSPGHRR